MSITAAFILIALFAIVVYDIWAAVNERVPTITQETKVLMDRGGVGAVALLIAVGFLLGHLFW